MTAAVVDGNRPTALRRISMPWLVVMAGLVLMYAPSYWRASQGLWQTDEFGHGPIIALIAAWLFWRERDAFFAPTSAATGQSAVAGPGWALPSVLFGAGALVFVAGRTLSMASAEFFSQWLVIGSALALLGGVPLMRRVWFAWVYLLFMVPLPASVIDAMTGPLKQAISVLVVDGLHLFGYPVARSGVMITVGAYQLLVADACSGLNSMFSLAALGTLFIYLVAQGRTLSHNLALVAAIVPIAFAANIVRVATLVLVTYHWGDEAGQGFLHGAAGILLMIVALMIFMALDQLLSLVWGAKGTDVKRRVA